MKNYTKAELSWKDANDLRGIAAQLGIQDIKEIKYLHELVDKILYAQLQRDTASVEDENKTDTYPIDNSNLPSEINNYVDVSQSDLQYAEISVEDEVIIGSVDVAEIDFSIDQLFTNMQKLVEGISKAQNTTDIQVTAKLNLYENRSIDTQDGYTVTTTLELNSKLALLVNGDKDVCGIFKLEQSTEQPEGGQEYILVADADKLRLGNVQNRKYSLLFFAAQDDEFVSGICSREFSGHIPDNLTVYNSQLDVNVEQLEKTRTVLCIDFGTSNTTVGCYLDENYVSNISNNDKLNGNILLNDVNFVRFFNSQDASRPWIEIIPTVVYVRDCSDVENITFLFGYEATARIKQFDYCSQASAFYGIKRWMNSLETMEDISDENGNMTAIRRGEIVKAYFKFVIGCAEHQFKCQFKNLHISSPVKLKSYFLDVLEKLLPEYHIEKEYALDEGVAVLYNTIADKIQSKEFDKEREYKALIIDCGGGTTDLAACSFNIQDSDFCYAVNIETSFENGDANFGGNNLTYRIMQFMKIVYANYYADASHHKRVQVDSLITVKESDIFRRVDGYGIDSIYADLEAAYAQAEKIIPTRYMEFENRPKQEYDKVKNNFYFLWEIAEEMKKQFFCKTDVLRNKFAVNLEATEYGDTDLNVTVLNKWKLSTSRGGVLTTATEIPNVVFNIKEISKLLKADIYNVVRKFLDKLYEQRELIKYDIIKLTGQSCKIDIFNEALKEFVPGKSIEFKQSAVADGHREDDSLELKLSCLRGVIRYFKAKKRGDIEVNLLNKPPVIPYSLEAKDYKGDFVVLIKQQQEVNEPATSIVKPYDTSEVEFYLKNGEGRVCRTYKYSTDYSQLRKTNIQGVITALSGRATKEDIGKFNDNTIRFFVYPDENSWGFFVTPVCRKDGDLKKGSRQYFAFEDDVTMTAFFDGER